MKLIKKNIIDLCSGKQKSCINLADEVFEFESTKENPDEECINCILDDILSVPEGEMRDFWIGIYREGRMKLECKRTMKSYIITQEFFDSII